MKKIIFILAMSMMAFTVSAQELVQSKFFDNTFIGVSTGVSAWLNPHLNGHDNFGDGIHSLSTVRLGKWFTPSVGGELTYEFGANVRPEFGHSSSAGANFLVNISNAIGGYKGEPRRVEVVPYFGGGWHHTHGQVTNNIVARAGSQVNFNMGKQKAWQINVIPSINYILTDNGYSNYPTGQPRFDVNRSWVNLQVGVTYKFKTSNGTHNFKFSDKIYTQKELDVYVHEVDALKGGLERQRNVNEHLKKENAQLKHAVHKLMEDNNRLMNEKKNFKPMPPRMHSSVGFEIGQYKILPVNRGNILAVANELKKHDKVNVVLVGHADAKTGTPKRNMELSVKRAEAVKAELVKLGVEPSRIEIVGKGDTVQPFDENDANRVVLTVVGR
jgi:outer membrane protein OmpA-like peptidoglycan-associated protein